jgi:hypothetical protein
MRALPRITLPERVLDALQSYQRALDEKLDLERAKDDPRLAETIEAFWTERRPRKALRAAERALGAMASGLERCMYCEDSQGCDVEHRAPKVPYPEKAFSWSNLLLICAPCNRQKNDNFDERLIDPTAEDPLEHLLLSFATGRYVVRDESQRGAATLRVLPRVAAAQPLVQGRMNALTKIKSCLQVYDQHRAEGRTAEAESIHKALVEEPFSAVFAAVLSASREPGAPDVLGEPLMAVLARHPAMYRWLEEADSARAEAAKQEIDALARAVRIRRAG